MWTVFCAIKEECFLEHGRAPPRVQHNSKPNFFKQRLYAILKKGVKQKCTEIGARY